MYVNIIVQLFYLKKKRKERKRDSFSGATGAKELIHFSIWQMWSPKMTCQQ